MRQNTIQKATVNFFNEAGEYKLEIRQGVITYVQTPLFTYNIMNRETYNLELDAYIQFFQAALEYNQDLFNNLYMMLDDKTIANSIIDDKILNASNDLEKASLKK